MVSVLVMLNTLYNCKVSFETVVVVRVFVAVALCDSVPTSAVCVAAKAVVLLP